MQRQCQASGESWLDYMWQDTKKKRTMDYIYMYRARYQWFTCGKIPIKKRTISNHKRKEVFKGQKLSISNRERNKSALVNYFECTILLMPVVGFLGLLATYYTSILNGKGRLSL